MAEHIISLNPFSPSSCRRAIRQYNKIVKEFNEKVDIFLQRIAERGREVFEELGYTPDSGEITVTVEKVSDGYIINAAGKGVVFLEFGAGDATQGNKYASSMPFLVYPSSYSEHHAHMYERYSLWIFGGVLYTEIVPREGMYTAWETIMQEWRDIAREVFA